MFIIIAAIQINEKYCDIYLIEHTVLAYAAFIWNL